MKNSFFAIGLSIFSLHVFSQNPDFQVHEWGTFTTLQSQDGRLLEGMYLSEEPLPNFVHDYHLPLYTSHKDYNYDNLVSNVRVRMETPVIYFYSKNKNPFPVTVNVDFKQGYISEFYPENNARINNQNNVKILGNNYGRWVNFDSTALGNIQWQTTVMPTDTALNYSYYAPDATPQWLAPRATKSNLIQSKWTNSAQSQVEKFLFYRGFGNFYVPFKIEYNQQKQLVLTNNFLTPVCYAMVYDLKAGDSIPQVKWSGSIKENCKITICEDSKSANWLDEKENFIQSLIKAGLFEDEARAMLETWKTSYFQNPGLRVFWIMPRYYTDYILPLNISPRPTNIERVMVGRSEFMTDNIDYSQSRFKLAYQDYLKHGVEAFTSFNDCAATTFSDYCAKVENPTSKGTFPLSIYPNPSGESISFKINLDKSSNLKITVITLEGRQVYSSNELQSAGEFEKTISVSSLPPSKYLLKCSENGKIYEGDFFKK